jgi:hypothetical protein
VTGPVRRPGADGSIALPPMVLGSIALASVTAGIPEIIRRILEGRKRNRQA